MRLAEIMTTSVQTIDENSDADVAFNQMRLHHIRHLVVMDHKQALGVISDRDLGGPRGASLRKGRMVNELMTPAPVTASPTMSVREAANLLRGRTIGCLPVFERGKLVGIVTTTDLLTLLGRGALKPVTQGKRWTLKHRASRRGSSSITTANV